MHDGTVPKHPDRLEKTITPPDSAQPAPKFGEMFDFKPPAMVPSPPRRSATAMAVYKADYNKELRQRLISGYQAAVERRQDAERSAAINAIVPDAPPPKKSISFSIRIPTPAPKREFGMSMRPEPEPGQTITLRLSGEFGEDWLERLAKFQILPGPLHGDKASRACQPNRPVAPPSMPMPRLVPALVKAPTAGGPKQKVQTRPRKSANKAHKAYKLQEFDRADLDDQEWARVQRLIPSAKKGGRPRTIDMRAVLNGILFVLESGCGWRSLPGDLSSRATCHAYYDQWDESGVMKKIHDILYGNSIKRLPSARRIGRRWNA